MPVSLWRSHFLRNIFTFIGSSMPNMNRMRQIILAPSSHTDTNINQHIQIYGQRAGFSEKILSYWRWLHICETFKLTWWVCSRTQHYLLHRLLSAWESTNLVQRHYIWFLIPWKRNIRPNICSQPLQASTSNKPI